MMVNLADYSPPAGTRHVMVISPTGDTYFSDWLDRRIQQEVQTSGDVGKISWKRQDSWESGTFQTCLEEAGSSLQAVVVSSHGSSKAFQASYDLCAPNIDGVPTCGPVACDGVPENKTKSCTGGLIQYNNVDWAGGSTCQCQASWSAADVVAELAKLPQKPPLFADFCNADSDRDDGTWHKEFSDQNYPWMGSSVTVQEGVGGDNFFLALMWIVLTGNRDVTTANNVKALNEAFQSVLPQLGGSGSWTYYPNN